MEEDITEGCTRNSEEENNRMGSDKLSFYDFICHLVNYCLNFTSISIWKQASVLILYNTLVRCFSE